MLTLEMAAMCFVWKTVRTKEWSLWVYIYIYIFFCFVIVYYSVFWWWWSFLVFIFGRCWHEHMAIAGSYTYTYILWMICFMYIIYFQHKECINYSVWQELSVQMPLVKVWIIDWSSYIRVLFLWVGLLRLCLSGLLVNMNLMHASNKLIVQVQALSLIGHPAFSSLALFPLFQHQGLPLFRNICTTYTAVLATCGMAAQCLLACLVAQGRAVLMLVFSPGTERGAGGIILCLV